MGLSTNVMYFCIIVGIFSQVAYYDGILTTQPTYLNLFINNGNGQYGLATGSGGANDFPIYAQIAILLGVGVLTSVILGFFSFPNPYLIFSGITGYLLLTFAVVPFNLFNQLPSPLNILLITLVGFVMIMGILDWFKGGTGEP